MRILVVYDSMTGNTQAVAELIEEELASLGNTADVYRIGMGVLPNPREYDAMIIGTYTWSAKGSTPESTKDFVADLGYKPDKVFTFATGDTQFGIPHFCTSADKLAKFYGSPLAPLKVEQYPNNKGTNDTIEWTRGVNGWLKNSTK